jgi:hypothetical protein
LVIRFEDLREDAVTVVERVADFLGITAARKQVEVAVQQASLANLRKIERERWQKRSWCSRESHYLLPKWKIRSVERLFHRE